MLHGLFPLAPLAAHAVDRLVSGDGKQPGAKAAPFFPIFKPANRAPDTAEHVLHEICRIGILQTAGIVSP